MEVKNVAQDPQMAGFCDEGDELLLSVTDQAISVQWS